MGNLIDLTKPFLLKLRVFSGEVVLLNDILEIHKELYEEMVPLQGSSADIRILDTLDVAFDSASDEPTEFPENDLILSDTFAEECIFVCNSLAQRLRKVVALGAVGEQDAYRLPIYVNETEYLRFILETEIELTEEDPEQQQEIKRILDRLISLCGKCKDWSKKHLASGNRLDVLKRAQEDSEIRDDALVTDFSKDIQMSLVSVGYLFNAVPIDREKYGEPDDAVLDIFDVYVAFDMGVYLDEPESREINTAWARVILIPPGKIGTILAACDAYSGYLADICTILYDEHEIEPCKVWVIDDFIIEPGYEGVAGDFLEWIKKYLTNEGIIIAASYSDDLDDMEGNDKYGEEEKKVRQFYAFHGFIPLGDTEYMFLKLREKHICKHN
ncbi:MAG: hypothetical protein PHX16_08795 [Syntrophaceticus sp.]|nr:hypothetical protein [Syntrophaceticus sp.]